MPKTTKSPKSNGDMISRGPELYEHQSPRPTVFVSENPTRWNSLALAYLLSGRLSKANDAIIRSLELDTSIANTWQIWARILLEGGHLEESENAVSMAIELEPKGMESIILSARIKLALNKLSSCLETLQLALQHRPESRRLWDLYRKCISSSER